MPSTPSGSSPAVSSAPSTPSAAPSSRSATARVSSKILWRRCSPTTERTSAGVTRRLSGPPASAAFATSPSSRVRSSPTSWTSSAAAASSTSKPLGGRARAQPGHQRATGGPRERDHRGGRQRPDQPVARRHLGVGQEQEHGGGIRRRGVGGEGLALPHAQRVGAAHHHQPALGEEGQRERGPHDGFRARLAGLEDFSRQGGHRGIREERAGDGRHRVVEKHGLGAVNEDDGRRAARLHRAEQPRIVH